MNILQKTSALAQLIRPELPAAAGVCVVLGQAIALGHLPPLPTVILGFLLGVFLSGSPMIFNDYFDLAVDRINAPQRPLPSGRVTQTEALAMGSAFAIIAWAIALAIHPIALALSLVTWTLGFLYNWKLKAAGVWGNLIVSSSVAMTFIMGGVSAGRASSPMLWIFALIAFCFDLAEEIAGDAMDMAGDQERESRSIAIRYGRTTALRISGLLFAAVVILTVFPILLGETSLGYLIPIAVMDTLTLFFTIRLMRSLTPEAGRASMRVLYLSASIGLVAFMIARFV